MIYNNALDLIGNTPILNLKEAGYPNVFVKLEKANPGGSIKDRAALYMINGAEEKGILNKDSVLVEATSGNTGIALAMAGKLKGYKVIIIMPDTMSIERRQLVKAFGAELILTEGAKDVSFIVAGIGSGGTIVGAGKFLKEKNKEIKVIGIEPKSSPLITENKSGPHKIQGIGANFIPKIYDKDIVDKVITVSDEDSYETVRLIANKLGILIGISSGANISGAMKLSDENPGKIIVTVAPDGVDKYMSMGIF